MCAGCDAVKERRLAAHALLAVCSRKYAAELHQVFPVRNDMPGDLMFLLSRLDNSQKER